VRFQYITVQVIFGFQSGLQLFNAGNAKVFPFTLKCPRCNCSMITTRRFWGIFIKGDQLVMIMRSALHRPSDVLPAKSPTPGRKSARDCQRLSPRSTIISVSGSPHRLIALSLVTSSNVPRSSPKNDIRFHNNTCWTFLKMWDQMKTTVFRSLSLSGRTNVTWLLVTTWRCS
jgi:hypothetical protein